jgi:hypothetical protein
MLREALTDWWISCPTVDLFAYFVFDFADFRKLSDKQAIWVIRILIFLSHPAFAAKKSPRYIFLL